MLSLFSLRFPNLKKYDYKYFIYQLFAAILSIVLGKLIALFFEKETFGQYVVFSMIFSFFTSVLSSPIIQSFRFAFTRLESISLFSFYRSIYIYFLLTIVIVFILSGMYNADLWSFEYIVFGLFVFAQINYDTNIAYINLIGQIKKLSIFQIINLAISILIVLFSYVVLKNTSFMVLCAVAVIPIFVLTLFSFKGNEIFLEFNVLSLFNLWHHEWTKSFIKFLTPLFLLPFLSWILNSSDKFILRYYYGDSGLALYSAAYSIGSKLFLIISGPIIIYLNHSTYQKVSEVKEHSQFWAVLKFRLLVYFIVGILLVIISFCLHDTIGNFLLSARYRDSFILIPFLAFANLILTSLFFLEQVVYAAGLTNIILRHYSVGAIINLSLNLLLIPKFGFFGAIFSFIFSLVVQFSYLFFMVRNYLLSSLKHDG